MVFNSTTCTSIFISSDSKPSFFTYIAIRVLVFPKPELFAGEGSIRKLVERIKEDGVGKVLIVTDANIRELGLLDEVIDDLTEMKIDYAVFDGVSPDPSIKNIDDAYTMYLDEECEGLIAVGGGSSIDCAKVAGGRVVSGKTVMQLKGNYKVRKELPPFYVIPTTSGTGSEATLGAVVSNVETHEKFTVADSRLVPIVAVLEPSLTRSLPPHITAHTGLDALTHAIEAYIGVIRTKEMKEYAEKAIKKIFENLEKAYSSGSDLAVRENMALAAFYAGVALTRGTGYVHAIGHNLGSLYGIPHGLAIGVVLPYMLEEYGSRVHERLAELAILCGFGREIENKADLADRFIVRTRELNESLGIPCFIKELEAKDIPLLAKRAAKEGNPIYPVPRIFNNREFERVLYRLLPE